MTNVEQLKPPQRMWLKCPSPQGGRAGPPMGMGMGMSDPCRSKATLHLYYEGDWTALVEHNPRWGSRVDKRTFEETHIELVSWTLAKDGTVWAKSGQQELTLDEAKEQVLTVMKALQGKEET